MAGADRVADIRKTSNVDRGITCERDKVRIQAGCDSPATRRFVEPCGRIRRQRPEYLAPRQSGSTHQLVFARGGVGGEMPDVGSEEKLSAHALKSARLGETFRD